MSTAALLTLASIYHPRVSPTLRVVSMHAPTTSLRRMLSMALLALPSPMDSGTTAENAISNTTSPSSGRLLEKLRATRLDPSDLQSRRQLAQQVLELRLPARRLAPTSMSLRLDQVLRQVQALSTLPRRHSHARARMVSHLPIRRVQCSILPAHARTLVMT